jgi:hypothetical protein
MIESLSHFRFSGHIIKKFKEVVDIVTPKKNKNKNENE